MGYEPESLKMDGDNCLMCMGYGQNARWWKVWKS